MIDQVLRRLRPERAPVPDADPIRLFVETLANLEESRPPPPARGGGGRISALDLAGPFTRPPRRPA